MRLLFWIVVMGLLAGGQAWAKSDLCNEKKECAVVYVAPWCPACKSMAPKLREAIEQTKSRKDFGIRVVVGRGSKEENEKEAASFAGVGHADQDDSLHDLLGVRAYPSFYVVDKKQKVLHRGQAAFRWLNEKLSQ